MNFIIISFFIVFSLPNNNKSIEGPFNFDLEMFKSSIDMIKEMPYQTGIFHNFEKYLANDKADQNDLPIM